MIIQGKELAASIRASLLQRAHKAATALGRPIGLFAIGSTDDYGAYVYLNKEVKAAQELGIRTQVQPINSNTSVGDFLALIKQASANPSIDAILIPRPLPEHLAKSGFTAFIAPEKDIDGMSNLSMGNLFLCKTWEDVSSLKTYVPCTAMAVVRLLDAYHINPAGMETVVIGRSPTVGKPLAHLLTCRNATVKICHTGTRDLKNALRYAELICSAAGQAGLLHADNVPAKATIIDISTNFDPQNKLCGDAKMEELLQKECSVSSVPGGVGPVTLACLLENIILSGERKI